MNSPKRIIPIASLLLSLFFILVPVPSSQALIHPHLGYGAFSANLDNVDMIKDLGFGWSTHALYWVNVEPTNNDYRFGDLDNILTYDQNNGLKPIIRVSYAPAWAWAMGNPPAWANQFGDLMAQIAQRVKNRAPGLQVAYVIWNEPNLSDEWGGRDPQPAWIVALLQASYQRIKNIDPEAVVVAPGMATVGGPFSGCGVNITAMETGITAAYTQEIIAAGAMNDLQFICGIYENGGKGYFDVLGTHPYGFVYEPERDSSSVNGLAFRRAKDQRDIMVAQGDGDKQMWAIEFGWLVNTKDSCGQNCDPYWQGRTWQIVTMQQQADYLVRAYDYAYLNWPWMGVMSLFNLDFATVYWYECCNHMRGYSITYKDNPNNLGEPIKYRPAYNALKNMPKLTAGHIGGIVRDNRGNPFTGATVQLGSQTTTSNSYGEYAFPVVIAGSYDLQASAPTYGTLAPAHLAVGEGEIVNWNFCLLPPDNIVFNGGLENDFNNWSTGGASAPAITNDAHIGNKAARLGSTATGGSWIEQQVIIPVGMYRPTLSFMYKYPSPGTGESAQVTVAGITRSLPTSSGWAQYWIDLNGHQGETVTIRFTASESDGTASYLYLDEVSLGKASGGPNRSYVPLGLKNR